MTGASYASGLSAAESLLVRQAGFEPAGLVMGSSVCHIGFQLPVTSAAQLTRGSYGTIFSAVPQDGGELTDLLRAMSTARKAALERLTKDARDTGADGVIAVSLETVWDSWYDGALEFTLTGTAIRRAAPEPGPGSPGEGEDEDEDDRPVFTAGLSGQDFWSLLRTGYKPAGFVMGYCAYAAEPDSATVPRELRGPTRAVYTAREKALDRMRSQAGQLRAKGIVGVRLSGLDELGRLPDTRVLEFRATGTAIVPVDGSAAADPAVTVLRFS